MNIRARIARLASRVAALQVAGPAVDAARARLAAYSLPVLLRIVLRHAGRTEAETEAAIAHAEISYPAAHREADEAIAAGGAGQPDATEADRRLAVFASRGVTLAAREMT